MQYHDIKRLMMHRYKLSENIDAQLKRMASDLKEIVDHLNVSNSNTDSSDPVNFIAFLSCSVLYWYSSCFYKMCSCSFACVIFVEIVWIQCFAFTLLVGHQEEHLACKKLEL